MNAKPVRGITVIRWIRRVLAVILAWNLGMGIYDLTTGRLFGLISFTCVLGLAAVMTYQTRVIHRIERANRPRPDYSAIAAMEREVYGETFEHAGAPMSSLPSRRQWCMLGHPSASLYSSRRREHCKECDEHRSNLRWERPS